MKLRLVSALAAGVGILLGGTAAAQDKISNKTSTKNSTKTTSTTKISNQQLAKSVASTLEKSGNLKGCSVDITCQNGIIELKGKIGDVAQHDAIVSTVLSVPGVKSVIDSMTLATLVPVRPATAEEPVAPPGTGLGAPPAHSAPAVDPIPLGQPGGAMPYDLNQPKLPPHAWPTYAPYNNFSRVAYPEAYPYNAWPFIGPFYPFPKVPLGWRSVTLEWQDGHWWMGRNGTKQDYWRVRYW